MTTKIRATCLLSVVGLLAVYASGAYAADEIIWHVKAVHPKGVLLDVKAIDQNGNIHDVKAIQEPGIPHLLDIKALIDGKRLPVKILVSDDQYAPVKAIGEDGTVYDIKALTPGRERLDVKGIQQAGSIIHIKAIGPDGEFYGIKAISPKGNLYDVKGVKMLKDRVELTISGVPVAAHIKAIPQVPQ